MCKRIRPGFLDVVANKKAEVVRIYLPPDANTMLSVTAHCLSSRNCVNVIVAGKQPTPQWLDMDAAIKHCTAGIGSGPWASNDQGGEPDVVMACCGWWVDASVNHSHRGAVVAPFAWGGLPHCRKPRCAQTPALNENG